MILRPARQLNHFQRPAQIDIQALFSDLRFSEAAQ